VCAMLGYAQSYPTHARRLGAVRRAVLVCVLGLPAMVVALRAPRLPMFGQSQRPSGRVLLPHVPRWTRLRGELPLRTILFGLNVFSFGLALG
jgi:hypothetical protein